MTTTLQQLVDRQEIADLVSRLGRALDEGRFDEMRTLLADDATVRTPGGEAAGREGVIAQARRNHLPEQPIQHLITNLLVDIDGDRAEARANLVVHFGPIDGGDGTSAPPPALPAPPVEYSTGEVYRFDFARIPTGWHFTRIEVTPTWTAGTPNPIPVPVVAG